MRNGSDLAVNFRTIIFSPGGETAITPTADPVFQEGQQTVVDEFDPGLILDLRARLPESPSTLARVRFETFAGFRQEYILVGSSAANASFVAIKRAVSFPS